MNNSQVRCFLTAAKYLSFTKAAEMLYLSQPGLSRQISALEAELGVELFVRSHNSIKLTKVGRVCEEHMEKIVQQYHEMVNDIEATKPMDNHSLSIAGLEGQLIGKCYEDALSRLWINYPSINLRMSYYPTSKLLNVLLSREADIIILPQADIPDNPNIAWKSAKRDRCCLVVPTSNAKANMENPCLKDFEDETFLILAENESPAIAKQHRSVCEIPGFVPERQYLVPTYGTLSMLLEAGIGISVLNRWHSLRNAPYLKFLDIPEIGDRVEAVAWRKDNKNPCIAAFVGAIQDV